MSGRMVLQEPGTFSCLGCVAAMITGEQLLDVAAFVGHDGSARPFRMTEIVQYLAVCGVLLGAYAEEPALKPTVRNIGTSMRRWPGRMISFSWSRGIEALLIVASASGKNTHAVYWTGKRVLDPEPMNAGKELAAYTIREWWPVIRVEA